MASIHELAEVLRESHDRLTIVDVSDTFGYIEFSEFPTNFNGPLKAALGVGMIVSAVNHHGDTLRLYFTEIEIGTVEDTVVVEKEVATLQMPDGDGDPFAEPQTVEIDRGEE